MTRKQAEAQVDLAIEYILRTAERGDGSLVLANRLYDHEPEAMVQLRRPWMVERLRLKITRRMRQDAPVTQMNLPGLESLPRRISAKPTKPSGQVGLLNANLSQLVELRKTLIREAGERTAKQVAEVDKAIAFIREHRGSRRGVKLGKLIEQYKFEWEAAIEPEAAKGGSL